MDESRKEGVGLRMQVAHLGFLLLSDLENVIIVYY